MPFFGSCSTMLPMYFLPGRVRQSRKARARKSCWQPRTRNFGELRFATKAISPSSHTRGYPAGHPGEAHAQEWNSHKKSAQTRLMKREGTHFLPLVSSLLLSIHRRVAPFCRSPCLSPSPLDKSSIVSPTASSPLGVARISHTVEGCVEITCERFG